MAIFRCCRLILEQIVRYIMINLLRQHVQNNNLNHQYMSTLHKRANTGEQGLKAKAHCSFHFCLYIKQIYVYERPPSLNMTWYVKK